MSFLKSIGIAMAASLACGALLFLASYGLPRGGNSAGQKNDVQRAASRGDGYAVLTLDASYPDRLVRDLLAGKGIRSVTGESSQWVFLDDFGALERVPLDGYRDRVEDFDLRDDGYAEQLRSFFVFQGERRLFISLRGGFIDLEGRVNAALGDIPFSLSVLNPPQSVLLPGLLFAVAAALALLLSREAPLMALFLPLWAPLAGLGVPGFALLAALAGLCRILREPAREYFFSRRYGKADGSRPGALAGRGVWALSLVFLAAMGCVAAFGGLPPLAFPLAGLFSLAILCLSSWAEFCRGLSRGHVRFRPVPIADAARRRVSYLRVMVPFALAALALMVLPKPSGAPSSREWTGWESPARPSAEMYREHVAFQRSFSYAPLGGEPQPYLRYALAGDGLIDGSGASPVESADFDEIPPFPLGGLIDFLDNYSYTDTGFNPPRRGELVCLLAVLALCVPRILRDRWGRGKLAMLREKRIAA
jgi:hypothetical protein